ncbi:MAG TPA: glycine cleavage T C-terminal barrel domain-containing protein [Chthoniobacterales bacterium]|jgi:folate-binding protein YgfZ
MLPIDPRRGSFFDLSDRIKLRLTGEDRIRFVNGQITNDIRKATASSALAACVLNAKGKLNGHIFLSVQQDSVLIDAAAALHETLPARLDRYIIADAVQIDDITAKFSMFHVLGNAALPDGCKTVSANRFGLPGFDFWVDRSERDRVAQSLAATIPFCDQALAETFRIEEGVPIWGRELTEEIIPVEANLEESCVDYEKGCYIGQEVISRMKISGQRNKSLCGFLSSGGNPLAAGMKLFSGNDENKEIGWITSAASSERLGKQIALGYVKRPFNQAGVETIARTGENQRIPVVIVNLPFATERTVND